MARPLAKSPFVLLALALWILACPASLAEDHDPDALNEQVSELIEQGRYQEAIFIAERALEVAKRTRGSEDPETADALSTLGLLFKKIGDYAKAERLYQEALRICQKVLGPERPETATILNNLASLYQDMGEYAKAEVQREWLVQLRDGKGPKFDKVKDAIDGRCGLLAQAVNLAGPFIMSSQGNP